MQTIFKFDFRVLMKTDTAWKLKLALLAGRVSQELRLAEISDKEEVHQLLEKAQDQNHRN